jgi:hypothetical protein
MGWWPYSTWGRSQTERQGIVPLFSAPWAPWSAPVPFGPVPGQPLAGYTPRPGIGHRAADGGLRQVTACAHGMATPARRVAPAAFSSSVGGSRGQSNGESAGEPSERLSAYARRSLASRATCGSLTLLPVRPSATWGHINNTDRARNGSCYQVGHAAGCRWPGRARRGVLPGRQLRLCAGARRPGRTGRRSGSAPVRNLPDDAESRESLPDLG